MNTNRNPYELGKAAAEEWLETDKSQPAHDKNPFPQFSPKWGLFNKGFNQTAYPHLFKKDEK